LIDTFYRETPDKQNQRNLVDLEQDAENKSRIVRFFALLIFYFYQNQIFYLLFIFKL
jgi:hypothetical protein